MSPWVLRRTLVRGVSSLSCLPIRHRCVVLLFCVSRLLVRCRQNALPLSGVRVCVEVADGAREGKVILAREGSCSLHLCLTPTLTLFFGDRPRRQWTPFCSAETLHGQRTHTPLTLHDADRLNRKRSEVRRGGTALLWVQRLRRHPRPCPSPTFPCPTSEQLSKEHQQRLLYSVAHTRQPTASVRCNNLS